MALTDNILAYWNLNNDGSGNVSLVDSTGNGNTLTNNGVSLGAGIIGNGAQWPTPFSSSPWLENDSVAISGDASISFWVNPSSFSDQSFYVPVCLGNESPNRIAIIINPDGTCTWLFNGSEASLGASINFGQWNHIAIVADSNSGNLTYYINGSATSPISVGYTGGLNNVYLGLANDQTGGIGSFVLEGNLDEIGIWSRVLSQAEVTELYNNGAGLTYPFIELYYNNAASDGDWGNLANWWQDSGFTIPATSLPDATIPVLIYGNITQNTAASNVCACYSAEFHNSTFGSAVTLSTSGLVNIFGTSVFQGTCTDSASIHDSSYFDTTAVVEGDATLRDSSYNLGTIQGNAYVYYDGGNGTYPIGGLVDGTVTYIGWPSKSPQYFNDTVSGGGNDQSWTNLANWWADSSFTTRPLNSVGTQALPDAGTVCYIATNAYSNTTGIAVQSVEILNGGSLGYGSITTNQLTLDVGSSIGVMTIFSPMLINASVVYGCTIYGNTEFNGSCNMQESSLYGGTMTIDSGAYIDGGEYSTNTIGVPIQAASSGGGGGGFISRLLNLPWFIKF
jgi:hypothetical protein